METNLESKRSTRKRAIAVLQFRWFIISMASNDWYSKNNKKNKRFIQKITKRITFHFTNYKKVSKYGKRPRWIIKFSPSIIFMTEKCLHLLARTQRYRFANL